MMLPRKIQRALCRRLCRSNGDFPLQAVSLSPTGKPVGNILLSFIIEPFLRQPGEPISHDHTHDWESWQMAQSFMDKGYAVDVIDYRNHRFKPDKRYDFFISARTNLESIAKRLNDDCIKVAHLDTAHWLFNNHAAYTRLLDLQQRRGVTLTNIKMVEPNRAIEVADLATILGNRFTMETYSYAGKEIHRIPISTPTLYPWDDEKDFDRCRNNYLWFGSSGFVHKGLDRVLEAFATMPAHRLTVCGPLESERAFVEAYRKELFETPNIETVGWIDINGPEFRKLARNTVGLIYPSCAEGGGGSAITCMHAGLIPLVTHETSVDIGEGGILLHDAAIPTIQDAVESLSTLPAGQLKQRARQAWETARQRHTREIFARHFDAFITEVLGKCV